MPTAPPSRCTDPECHDLATTNGRCDAHQRPPWQQRSKAWGKGSTTAWRRFRRDQLRREWLCRHCGTKATEVDHIRPLSQGGAKWDPGNVQSLCSDCHDAKSEADAAELRRIRSSS